ncbi:VOC family protein [Algoriphagus limi]|uniref:VOC family protein n=1 Tax=Algoriphagus limi TaxID=2975273 RepID=A0ABT2G649_9BACT|nr:VOC family protein [Algoriphagus limi]MCS5490679.1 VOC family protein [Algoriphagus limi]
MKIEHLAIWASDLETMREFYCNQLGFQSNELYHNPKRGFYSYFLSGSEGARLELMSQADIMDHGTIRGKRIGLAHFAISLGSEERVDQLTEVLRSAGTPIIGEPRRTGDGYYESIIADPEGNWIELTV